MKKFALSGFKHRTIEEKHSHPQPSTSGQTFYFCEKDTGAVRFCLMADDSGHISEDHAAGLLAMQCMTHGLSPSDYMVLVPARSEAFERVSLRANELLETGRAIATPVQLSAREREVLGGIMTNMLNKEIAAQLNISERTVKFHVSSLLSKFRVRSRFELMQVAQGAVAHPNAPVEPRERIIPMALRLQTA
jgi:DNA-binding CsgD family transcriptional regulator